MQELFMACVEAVKSDIKKRCLVTLGLKNNKLPEVEGCHKLDSKLFTDGDKRKVIDRLMSNENVLLFLYDKLFPTSTDVQRSPQKIKKQAPSVLKQKYPEMPIMSINIDKAKVKPSDIAKRVKRPATAVL